MRLKKGVYTTGLIMFVLALLVASIEVVAFSTSFFEKQYTKLDTAQSMGLSQDDLMKATHQLLDYIKGDVDTINVKVTIENESVDMFNQKEVDHMVDVQDIFMNVKLIKNIFFGISLALFTMSIINKDIFDVVMGKTVIRNAINVLVIVIGLVVIYAIVDFSKFWITFHELLFTNDLWLLDPRTDRMINMFPEVFFNTMVMQIILIFVISLALISIGYILFYRHVMKRGNTNDSYRTI